MKGERWVEVYGKKKKMIKRLCAPFLWEFWGTVTDDGTGWNDKKLWHVEQNYLFGMTGHRSVSFGVLLATNCVDTEQS